MTKEQKPVARDIGEKPTFARVTLEYPKEFEGREYREITIVRLTAGEVAQFQDEIEALLQTNPEARVRFPLFRDAEGAILPEEVMDIIDDDDRLALEEAAANFLPRRFRGVMDSASGPANGENIAASS